VAAVTQVRILVTARGANFFVVAEGMGQRRKKMRRPGIEPGSTAWKAAMLTIIPPTLAHLTDGQPFTQFGISKEESQSTATR
jgi:hypothetical protein